MNVHITVTSTFGSPLDRDDRRTVASMTATDIAARQARAQLERHGGSPSTLRLAHRVETDRDDDATFTYYTDHTFTFTDDLPADDPTTNGDHP